MSFFRILFLLFLSIPILEIYLLLEVSDRIGPLSTVGLVVFTAVVGVWLLRLQGFATLARVQQSIARGEIPATALFEGVMLFVAGALLLTPGFFTDTIGFLLLIPFTRQWIVHYILRSVMKDGRFHVRTTETISPKETPFQQSSSKNKTIEGEFIPHDD